MNNCQYFLSNGKRLCNAFTKKQHDLEQYEVTRADAGN